MDNFEINIYIETSSHGPAIRKAAGMWMIEYIKKNGDPETRQGVILKESTTENALALELMSDALSKLTKPCLVRVNTQCEHILNVMKNYWLPQWKKNDWKNAKGKPVKNEELWKQCSELMDKHTVTFENTSHSYRSVMQDEIRKGLEK